MRNDNTSPIRNPVSYNNCIKNLSLILLAAPNNFLTSTLVKLLVFSLVLLLSKYFSTFHSPCLRDA